MENPNYFAVVPAKIRYDDRLRANEKLLYGEITALANKDGKCWATNSYFAKIYKVGTSTISTWINNLAKNGYVVLKYVYRKNTNEIEKREITLTDVSTIADRGIHKIEIGVHKKIKGYSQNRKENNTSINKEEEEEENQVDLNHREEMKEIIDFYENNITLITPFVAEDIGQYLKNGLQSELIIECMKEAVSRNKRNWHYVVSILNDCCNNNIKTARQFKIKQEEFKSQKNNSKKQVKAKEKVEYKEVNYNEEEYKKKILEKG